MILNGSQRGGAQNLAKHLSNMIENDHVTLHDLRGFTSETLGGAFQENDAVAKGTQCKQFLFSLSLSPPQTERVGIADFEDAIEQVEKRLGLTGQPRAIVFHEKKGRRHAHAVWSRIDVQKMKAINLPFYHNRLTELSKDLFLAHNWRIPDGLRDRENRDPRNFTLAEWQQAKRVKKDPRKIKRVFQEAWQISDTAAAFKHALEEKGYVLARGDRGRHVGVDVHGEVYAVPKWVGVRTNHVREKLGDANQYPSVAEAKDQISTSMQMVISQWKQELSRAHEELKKEQEAERRALVRRQREEREALMAHQQDRQQSATIQRQARFRTGLRGIWDRLRGEHKRIQRENEHEAWSTNVQDREQTDDLIFSHIEQRRDLEMQNGQDLARLIYQIQNVDQERSHFDTLRSQKSDGPQINLAPER